jgi:uncharacterized protein YabE (DUF348 family)
MKIKVINGRENRLIKYAYICGAGLVIAVIGYVVYLVALDRVALCVDGRTYLWRTTGSTVAEVLKEKKVILNEGDLVEPGLKTPIKEGSYIDVIRAFPVTIKAGGKINRFFTAALPVKAVLKRAGVKLDEEDKVKPGPNVLVKPDQTITVIDISSKVISKQVVLNPGTEYRKDKNLERGVEEVVRHGKEGLAERQIKIVYQDGREVNRYRIAQKILKPAVTAIIALGIKPVIRTLETSRGSFRYVEMKVMVATAYYPGPECCGKYAVYGETFTGKKAGFGLVAVDPRVIPLGTKLYIEGYGKAEAADIGSAIKKNRIDLCYETYKEAALYGTKKIKVYILE